MNLTGIASAIATRYDNLTPPSGYDAITTATHLPPQNLVSWPSVLVIHTGGALSVTASNRSGLLEFAVRFFLPIPSDLSKAIEGQYAWLPVLIEALDGQVHLGEGDDGVAAANVTGYQVGFLTWGGEEFPGIELTVEVRISEGKTYTA